jgi:hypothetical protein
MKQSLMLATPNTYVGCFSIARRGRPTALNMIEGQKLIQFGRAHWWPRRVSDVYLPAIRQQCACFATVTGGPVPTVVIN